jgi:hypothetical protein
MRQVHRAGEKLFVDYSGKKLAYFDHETGERVEVEMFVAVLGASNYTYAEPTRTQRVADADVERRDLLEILEDRYDHSSTVIATQVPTKNWHSLLTDRTIADAICDRVVHNAHVLALKGPSLREQKGMNTYPTT